MEEEDFGFSAVSADDIEVGDDRAERMANLIISFINKLMENSDKDYIYWPDRVKKLNAFKKRIKDILEED